MAVKKIVVIGPESTGKSTLCKQLAHHFNTLWCPEYAREYLLIHGKHYSYDDLLAIAKGQLQLEDEYMEKVQGEIENEVLRNKKAEAEVRSIEAEGRNEKLLAANNKFLFIDTDMYVMKVWCEYVFGKCHQWILDEIKKRKYDLYLLCNIDLPWVPDEFREYPEEAPRKELYTIYKNILSNQQTPWVEISGDYDQRLKKALIRINQLSF